MNTQTLDGLIRENRKIQSQLRAIPGISDVLVIPPYVRARITDDGAREWFNKSIRQQFPASLVYCTGDVCAAIVAV